MYTTIIYKHITHHHQNMQFHSHTQDKDMVEKRQRELYLVLPSYVQGLETETKGSKKGKRKSEELLEKREHLVSIQLRIVTIHISPGGKT